MVNEPTSFVGGNHVVKAVCGAFLLNSSSRGGLFSIWKQRMQ